MLEREVAGAAGEFLEADARVGGQHRQPHLGEEFIVVAARSS